MTLPPSAFSFLHTFSTMSGNSASSPTDTASWGYHTAKFLDVLKTCGIPRRALDPSPLQLVLPIIAGQKGAEAFRKLLEAGLIAHLIEFLRDKSATVTPDIVEVLVGGTPSLKAPHTGAMVSLVPHIVAVLSLHSRFSIDGAMATSIGVRQSSFGSLAL